GNAFKRRDKKLCDEVSLMVFPGVIFTSWLFCFNNDNRQSCSNDITAHFSLLLRLLLTPIILPLPVDKIASSCLYGSPGHALLWLSS
ncbi:hypothetical protein L9F63_006888, partial [Diploptera punctata]